MKEWPGGSHLVMESQHPDGFPLIAIGYKYNSKKVVSFVATKGCGDTEAGIPYEARWKDDNGNTMVRDVKRPEIVSKYFTKCNSIDVHNKNRQYDLKLEKHWKSNCGYFRCITTLFGMTITDCWNGYKHHLSGKHRHKAISIMKFASILCKDCLNNKFDKERPSDKVFSIGVEASTPEKEM